MENKNLQLTVSILSAGIVVSLFIFWYQNSGIRMDSPIVSVLVAVIGAIAFFLIIREIVTWYWKINRIVNLLEKIEKNTSRQENQDGSH